MRPSSGAIVQKMTCQLDMLNTKPPTVGPSAGATEMTTEIMPITLPRRCGGTRVIATVIRVGIIKAVPVAWNTRPTSSTPKAGASAASTVPARKTTRRCQEDLPGGELIHEKAGGRDDHAHGEEETGKQPLGGGRGDAEVRHDGGQRHRQGGLVQDHHHRAENEDGEVDFYLCGNVGIWFLRHPDRILRPRVAGKVEEYSLVSSSAR